MMLRAEKVLARAWQRAQSRILPREGFLEDALAAALEHPSVWPWLSQSLKWHERLPQFAPSVRTQYSDAAGRTDIELSWPDQQSPVVILELKVSAPPTSEQIGRYLTRENVLLVGIGSWSNEDELRASLPIAEADRLLGVITWGQIRQLVWEEAPLEFRQLQYLLDAMGITMPRTDEQQLAGLRASLPLWTLLDNWIPAGLAAMRDICTAADVATTRPNGPSFENGWYAGRLSGVKGIPIELTLWGGLILHDESYPPLLEEFPDLTIHIEIDTRSPLSQLLQEDTLLGQALEYWVAETPTDEARAGYRTSDSWAVLSTRTSSAILLHAADQRETFVGWLRESTTALVEHGILQRIAVLAQTSTAQHSAEEE